MICKMFFLCMYANGCWYMKSVLNNCLDGTFQFWKILFIDRVAHSWMMYSFTSIYYLFFWALFSFCVENPNLSRWSEIEKYAKRSDFARTWISCPPPHTVWPPALHLTCSKLGDTDQQNCLWVVCFFIIYLRF